MANERTVTITMDLEEAAFAADHCSGPAGRALQPDLLETLELAVRSGGHVYTEKARAIEGGKPV